MGGVCRRAVGTLILMAERGYRDGMRLAWFLATLAVPGWFTVTFRSIAVDAVTGVAIATLLALFARPFAGHAHDLGAERRADRRRGRLTGLLSDALNRILIPGTVLEAGSHRGFFPTSSAGCS